MLYPEKIFGSILLGAPLVRHQLAARLRQLAAAGGPAALAAPTGSLLAAMHELIDFWVPAAFRIGYLVRCCTWEGRPAGSAHMVYDLLQETLVMLVRLTGDLTTGITRDPYVRTNAAALLPWQPWHSSLPACCYQEETCKAMLARFGHHCDVHRNQDSP